MAECFVNIVHWIFLVNRDDFSRLPRWRETGLPTQEHSSQEQQRLPLTGAVKKSEFSLNSHARIQDRRPSSNWEMIVSSRLRWTRPQTGGAEGLKSLTYTYLLEIFRQGRKKISLVAKKELLILLAKSDALGASSKKRNDSVSWPVRHSGCQATELFQFSPPRQWLTFF